MTTFSRSTDVDASVEALFDYHARPGALRRLSPPWEDIDVQEAAPPTIVGSRAVVRTTMLGPLKTTIVARIVESSRPGGFVDVAEAGPFKSWRHRHGFTATGPTTSRIDDVVDYESPGWAIGRSVVDARLQRMFRWRHATTALDLQLLAACPPPPGAIVGVTGASGLIGEEVQRLFAVLGVAVKRFVRRAARSDDEIAWDPATGALGDGAEGLLAVVHLAGENIGAGRLDEAKKRRVLEDRGAVTRRLVDALGALARPPQAFLSASGVGWYADRGAEVLDDDSPAGTGFLTDVCRAWEEAAASAARFGIRTASLRFGIVLSPASGALPRMLLPFSAGLGGPLGPGTQGMPVLAIDDAAAIVWRAVMDGRVSGPVAATMPGTGSNAAFTRDLAAVLHRPAVLRVPRAALRVALGELADLGVLASCYVEPKKLQALGHRFRHASVQAALRHVLGR